MTNKTLLLIFLFFVGIYLMVSKLISSRATPDFHTEIIKVDTAQITTIEITPQPGPSYAIHRTEQNWIVTNGNVNIKAASNQLKNVLEQVDTIRTIRLITDQKKDWDQHGVSPDQGNRIRIYLKDGQIEDFIIGRSDFDAESQQGIAFMRLFHQNEVYAVHGFLPFQLEKHFNDFRKKALFEKNSPLLSPDRLVYQSQDTLIVARQLNNSWTTDGQYLLDSTKMASFLEQLESLEGRVFVDDFDELSATRFFHQSLTFFDKTLQDSVLLTCFRDSTRRLPFIIHSSYNPKSYFGSDSTGLYQDIFERAQTLLSQ